MYYDGLLILASVALGALMLLACYLAVTRDFIEIEFKSFPPSIRIIARR